MSSVSQTINYLFLLKETGNTAILNATNSAQSLKIKVLSSISNSALEVKCNDAEAKQLFASNLFTHYSGTDFKNATLKTMNDAQKSLAKGWNVRFSKSYTNLSIATAVKSKAKPIQKNTNTAVRSKRERLKAFLDTLPDAPPSLKANSRENFGEKLKLVIKDPQSLRQFKQASELLNPNDQEKLYSISNDTVFYTLGDITQIFEGRLEGLIAVGIFFIESSNANEPHFTDEERTQIFQKVKDSLNYLASEHPGNKLQWAYDDTQVILNINLPDTPNIQFGNLDTDDSEKYWRDPALGILNYYDHQYQADISSIDKLNTDIKNHHNALSAFTILITAYSNDWFGYAINKRIVISRIFDFGYHGISDFDNISAHEITHVFGSSDEYDVPDYEDVGIEELGGVDKIPNGNFVYTSKPHYPCLMMGDTGVNVICSYTRGQIGWSHFFVELFTGNVANAGTNDDVWIDIGDKQYLLVNNEHDDKEKGYRNGYAIWDNNFNYTDLKRVLIRKAKDGKYGGWYLEKVVVRFRGAIIFQANANRWLQDNELFWFGGLTTVLKPYYPNLPQFYTQKDLTLINTLTIQITTGIESNAGTNDTITLFLGDRSWVLDNPKEDNFENGKTDTFKLDPGVGLYLTNISPIKIVKSKDGKYGGWLFAGLKVIANENTILYHNVGINQWLMKDNLTWPTTPITFPDIPANQGVMLQYLQVRIKTGNEKKAGTNDKITLNINGAQWDLDNPGKDDFEKNNLDIFSLDPRGLMIGKELSVSITKAPDGDSGGWLFESIEIIGNNGKTILSERPNFWMERNILSWSKTISSTNNIIEVQNPLFLPRL